MFSVKNITCLFFYHDQRNLERACLSTYSGADLSRVSVDNFFRSKIPYMLSNFALRWGLFLSLHSMASFQLSKALSRLLPLLAGESCVVPQIIFLLFPHLVSCFKSLSISSKVIGWWVSCFIAYPGVMKRSSMVLLTK